MFLAVARTHYRRLKPRGSRQSSEEKHNIAAVPIAAFQHIHDVAIVFNILFLLLFCRALALVGKVADLLCPGVELAHLLVPIGFVSHGLLRRRLDLFVVAYEVLYFLIPVMPSILPEFLRASHLPSAVIKT